MENRNKIQKKFDKSWEKHLASENNKFEDYYKSLYDNLEKRFRIEFEKMEGWEEKTSFLSQLMDEIIEAKHLATIKYNLSPIIEKHSKRLDGLFTFFDKKIQELSTNKSISVIHNSPTTKKRDPKTTQWFKTGVFIADGAAKKLHDEIKSWEKVAVKLGFKKTTQNYFSQSIRDTKGQVKNLYSNEDKYKAVYLYCKENNIEMCDEFLENGKKFCL